MISHSVSRLAQGPRGREETAVPASSGRNLSKDGRSLGDGRDFIRQAQNSLRLLCAITWEWSRNRVGPLGDGRAEQSRDARVATADGLS